MLGTLSTTEDGRHAVRFERTLAHPPAKVWRALTEMEHLRHWFPAVVTFDLTPGAPVRFAPTPEQIRRGYMDADAATYGEITRVEPPRLLEYTWAGEILRFELQPAGEQGCRLVFTNIVDDRETAIAVSAGWHAGLEAFEAELDGRAIDWSPWDRSDELTGVYQRRLG